MFILMIKMEFPFIENTTKHALSIIHIKYIPTAYYDSSLAEAQNYS